MPAGDQLLDGVVSSGVSISKRRLSLLRRRRPPGRRATGRAREAARTRRSIDRHRAGWSGAPWPQRRRACAEPRDQITGGVCPGDLDDRARLGPAEAVPPELIRLESASVLGRGRRAAIGGVSCSASVGGGEAVEKMNADGERQLLAGDTVDQRLEHGRERGGLSPRIRSASGPRSGLRRPSARTPTGRRSAPAADPARRRAIARSRWVDGAAGEHHRQARRHRADPPGSPQQAGQAV